MVRQPKYRMKNGFTLAEVALIIAIVGLFMGGLLIPLATQFENSKTQANLAILAQIKQALISYAVMNNRLPCPASLQETGEEDCSLCPNLPNLCQLRGLPWAQLGVGRYDAWSEKYDASQQLKYPFQYQVDSAYVNNLTNLVNLPKSSLAIDDVARGTIMPDLVAVVIYCGKDGECTSAPHPCDSSKTCYSKQDYLSGITDDQLIWLSRSILAEQLVIAGKIIARREPLHFLKVN